MFGTLFLWRCLESKPRRPFFQQRIVSTRGGRGEFDDRDFGAREEADARGGVALHADAAVDVEPGVALSVQARLVALAELRERDERGAERGGPPAPPGGGRGGAGEHCGG